MPKPDVEEGFVFRARELFTGYNEEARSYDKSKRDD